MKDCIKCPECEMKYLTVGCVNGKIFFYCSCGYGKEEYLKELHKKK